MFGYFVSQVRMCCFNKFSLAENILMDNQSKKNFIFLWLLSATLYLLGKDVSLRQMEERPTNTELSY